jgi:hypothetical protein
MVSLGTVLPYYCLRDPHTSATWASHLVYWEPFSVIFYKILRAASQKWIVISPNNSWSAFHRKVLFIHIGRIRLQRCADLEKRAKGAPSNLTVHLRTTQKRALWLVEVIGEDSLCAECGYTKIYLCNHLDLMINMSSWLGPQLGSLDVVKIVNDMIFYPIIFFI